MATGYYELYQLKPIPENRDLRYRPLRYLREHARYVTIDNYINMIRGNLRDGENVKKLREWLEGELNDNIVVNISDVIAVTTDGITAAYYVDPTKLILLPDFFHQPTSGALITIDSENCPLDGRKGSWMTVDTLRIDGRDLFLMQSQDYGRDALYVVVDETGKEIAAHKNGFTKETIEQIRSTLKELEARQAASVVDVPDKKPKLEVWQQYFENGEYLRAAEISEEQNYNMIDGTANNRAPKRSILERLQEKQGQVGAKASTTRAVESLIISEEDRVRK